MSETDEKRLVQDIENAFTNSSYPGDDNLVYDNTTKYWDVYKTKQDFLGKHWKDLSIDTINNHRDDLPAFTIEAFCFYLPAFLIASISYPIALIDVLPDNLISNLAPHEDSNYPNENLSTLVEILTSQQKKLVMDFLLWYRDKYVLEELRRFHQNLERAIRFWADLTSGI
jgi:hypothetical protein